MLPPSGASPNTAAKIIERVTGLAESRLVISQCFNANCLPAARVSNLISDVLPYGRLWYGEPNAISNAIGYAKFFSRSRDAVIRVYDETGNVIETHEHTGDFREW